MLQSEVETVYQKKFMTPYATQVALQVMQHLRTFGLCSARHSVYARLHSAVPNRDNTPSLTSHSIAVLSWRQLQLHFVRVAQ
jgi:hypothetical protein